MTKCQVLTHAPRGGKGLSPEQSLSLGEAPCPLHLPRMKRDILTRFPHTTGIFCTCSCSLSQRKLRMRQQTLSEFQLVVHIALCTKKLQHWRNYLKTFLFHKYLLWMMFLPPFFPSPIRCNHGMNLGFTIRGTGNSKVSQTSKNLTFVYTKLAYFENNKHTLYQLVLDRKCWKFWKCYAPDS